MKRHLFYLSSLICVLTLISSACATLPTSGQVELNPNGSSDTPANVEAGSQGVEAVSAGAGMDSRGQAAQPDNAAAGLDTGDQAALPANAVVGMEAKGPVVEANDVGGRFPEGGQVVDSQSASQNVGQQDAAVSDGSTANTPSLEQRDAILNGVNMSPPVNRDPSSGVVVAGPMPGTESGPSLQNQPVPYPAPVDLDNLNKSPDISGWTIRSFTGWISALLQSILSR